MPSIALTQNLKEEYTQMFNSCVINPARISLVDSLVNKIQANKSRYQAVASSLVQRTPYGGMPWAVVSVIHCMEASLNFNTHLHNGDPLTARTVHVPAGRPLTGNPPFTWEASASDALRYQGFDKWNDWSVPGTLYKLEGYNGFGYRRRTPPIATPYLWSFSNHYTKGKFVSDGAYDPDAVSAQCGAAVLLKRINDNVENIFAGVNISPAAEEPLVKFSNTKIQYGEELQAFLNKFPGISLTVDGAPGKNTSDAFKKVTGYYLKGDSRAS